MMFNTRTMTTLAGAIALFSAAAQAQDFDLSWRTIDGGGAMFSKAGAFELSGTIGQVDAGAVSAGAFTVSGGFWPGAGGAPPAIGACCLDGDCKENMAKEECAEAEGEWHQGESCDEACPPEGCSGKEAFTKVACKIKREAVKKLIVKIKKGIPLAMYRATLNTGQFVDNNAKRSGKVVFKFTRGNKPPCGPNGVTVSTAGEDCISQDFECKCR